MAHMNQVGNNNNDKKQLRIFLIPFFALGHMIPMADLAVLLSRHPDVEPTLCLTPANADFIRPSLPTGVSVLLYPFPSEPAGLPAGQENLSSVPSDQVWRIYRAAVELSRPAHQNLLTSRHPDAVIADIFFHWTNEIAFRLSIPKITWHAVGVFPQLVMNSLHEQRDKIIAGGLRGTDELTVPDIPDPPIRMPVSEMPEFVRTTNSLSEIRGTLRKAKLDGFGVVVNSFYEMEPDYCDYYRRTNCKKGWFVGPVALARASGGEEERRVQDDDERHECLRWLDGKVEGSVVFVCFGSWCYFKEEQLKEIAAGLERSSRAFLWVVREEGQEWRPDDGWEGRVNGRGKVVKGWAPQVEVLRHRAVGVFLSHCSWNSVLESMGAGVPLLSWPLVFEQFINERLVVEVAGVGLRVWEGFRSTKAEEKVVVPADAITRAVKRFIEEEGKDGARTKRAREYAAMARAAVAEGGSSWKDLGRMVDDLWEAKARRLERDN